MSGDFSRNTFEPAKNFSLVRMQQGRLFTDADWNEQGDILRGSDRATAADLIGPAGFPQDDAGFALSYDAGADALVIGPGAGYVAGVRHALDPDAELEIEKQSGSGANTVWKIGAGGPLSDGDTLATGPLDAPAYHNVRDFTEAQDGTRSFRTTPALPAGTTSVRKATTVNRQPFAPQDAAPDSDGDYVAFLKSLDLPVTALDDPDIREVAFDGPDTATRDRAIWQVKLISRTLLLQRGLGDADLTCPAMADGINPVLAHQTPGRLRARAEAGAISAGPCALPPSAGYRSLENLLYRVEIHTAPSGAGPTSATYKWSRENAIHRTRYQSIDGGALVVDSVGRDELTALKPEDWIEIRDQDAIWDEAPGFFARISEVVGDRVSLAEVLDPESLTPLTDGGEPDVDKLPRAAFVTRWEGGKPTPIALSAWIDLENGVQVEFGDGRYQPGDYWTIPARSVAGDIEWPAHPVTGEPVPEAPEGPRRDYAALAKLSKSPAGWSIDEDCRPIFPTAVHSLQFLYGGGDGQEALPDPLSPATRVTLPEALRASVVRGHEPVAGETIRFEIVKGDGRFGNGLTTEDAITDAEGVAEVSWSLDASNFSQQVAARRLNAAGTDTHAPILYNASLSRADKASFDPANTPELSAANTVQKAIEMLAGMQQLGCSTHILTPDPGWEKVLETLPPGANVSICFSPGVYALARTVIMNKLGDVSLHGASPGTASIVIDRTESAMAFSNCASVSVRDLSVSTPAGASGVDAKLKGNRKGTLDFTECAEVVVEGCAVHCGAGTSPERTCVTSRGSLDRDAPARPTKSVCIRDNAFTVGHMQEAVLVTDAADVDVSGNRISAASRKGASLSLEKFQNDKAWLAKAVSSLVARPVKGGKQTKGADKVIRAEKWRVGFRSPAPQSEWDAMVKANPPSQTELSSLKRFEKYANGIIQKAAKEPARFPSIDGQIRGLAKGLGTSVAELNSKPDVITNVLVTSEPKAYRFDAKRGEARGVVLEANGNLLSFDSPVSQADWNKALSRYGAKAIANPDQLLTAARNIARQLILDPQFRSGLGSVENWLGRFRDDSPGLVSQGVVCAGRVLGNVAVRSNTIHDSEVGVRVAPSHMQDQKHVIASVLIENNRMELMGEGPDFYAAYGVFVGNAETVRILGNDMALSPRPNFRQFFAQGIRIWGFVGREVLVSQNRISMATMGVRLHHVEKDVSAEYLWVFSQNLIEGPKGTRDFKVVPSGVHVEENNRVFRGL